MAMTSTELYDWIISNWQNKTNFLTGDTIPTEAPPNNFGIFLNTSNKKVYAWNDLKEEYKEGLGGGGGFEGVLVSTSDDLSVENGKAYILNGDSINNKNMIITLENFSEFGEGFRIIDGGVISSLNTVNIVPQEGVTINGANDTITFDVVNGTIELYCTKVTKTGDTVTGLDFILYSYGTSKSVSDVIDIKNADFEATNNKQYMVDCTSSAITVILPQKEFIDVGYTFSVWDYLGNSVTNNITIDFVSSGVKLNNQDTNYEFDVNNSKCKFIYINELKGFQTLYDNF